jgi:hypothetical protein
VGHRQSQDYILQFLWNCNIFYPSFFETESLYGMQLVLINTISDEYEMK